jgi:hypothetical protein
MNADFFAAMPAIYVNVLADAPSNPLCRAMEGQI